MLVDHDDLGLIIRLRPGVDGRAVQELDLKWSEGFHISLKKPIEGVAREAELCIDAFGVGDHLLHICLR